MNRLAPAMLLASLALLLGCSAQRASEEKIGMPGYFQVEADGTLDFIRDGGLVRASPEELLRAHGSVYRLPAPGNAAPHDWEAGWFQQGPEGRLIIQWPQEGRFRYELQLPADPPLAVSLSSPDATFPEPGNMPPWLNQAAACFLGEIPVVIFERQLVVAYNERGAPLWSYISAGDCDMAASADGSRLLLTSQYPGCSCLNAQGELVWRDDALFDAVVLGNRFIGFRRTESGTQLACLDANGVELWSRNADARCDYLVRLCVRPDGGGFIIAGDREFVVMDPDGKELWRRQSSRQFYILQLALAQDGYVFVPENASAGSRTVLGGRLGSAARRELVWHCFDPQGTLCWTSRQQDMNTFCIPGIGGEVYLLNMGSGGSSAVHLGTPDAAP